MAKKMVKCLFCGETFDRNVEEFEKIKNRYAHKVCYVANKENLEKTEKDRMALEEYIPKLLGEGHVSAKVRQQLNSMISEGYTYYGIHKTLIFFYEIKGNSTSKANGGIGIVPFVYKDALAYYKEIHEKQEKNRGKEVSAAEDIVVKIAPPKLNRKIKLFDLEEES